MVSAVRWCCAFVPRTTTCIQFFSARMHPPPDIARILIVGFRIDLAWFKLSGIQLHCCFWAIIVSDDFYRLQNLLFKLQKSNWNTFAFCIQTFAYLNSMMMWFIGRKYLSEPRHSSTPKWTLVLKQPNIKKNNWILRHLLIAKQRTSETFLDAKTRGENLDQEVGRIRESAT